MFVMFAAIASLTLLGLALGFLPGPARYLKVETNPLLIKLNLCYRVLIAGSVVCRAVPRSRSAG
ncbi:MAG: hypothetical protein R3F37_08700 [Candidatus Competibacteraceae bacterium]